MHRILLAIGALSGATALAAATYTVTTTADAGAGSLRQAILDGNGNPGADTIEFNIPGSGVHTISPVTGLPPITSPVLIDGYTQPGASANTDAAGDNAVLLIELEGSAFPFTQIGLELAAGSSGSTIRGLVVNAWPGPQLQISNSSNSILAGNFVGTDPTGTIARPNSNTGANFGVYIVGGTATNDIVGGTAPADRNLISGNPHDGVQTLFGSGHKIQGNFIGTDATGTLPLGNGGGVTINSASNVVGGIVAGAGNLVSANTGTGVLAQGNASGFVLQGNLIGTDVSGTKALGNGAWGVLLNGGTPNAMIGGPAEGARNVISGNASAGVLVYSSEVVIQGNVIGTDVTGTVPLGNALTGAQYGGIFLNTASNCVIGGPNPGEGNVIAFNAGDGVTVFGFGTEAGNTIRGNSIYAQAPFTVPLHPGLAIDLGDDGPTANDAGDADSGVNGFQNYPIVTSATPLAPTSGTRVLGIFRSKPSTAYTLDFYENTPCLPHPHDYYEGQTYLGAADVVTDGTGAISFDVTVAGTIGAGSVVVGTATDPGGNTSELTPRIVFAIDPISGPAAGGTAVTHQRHGLRRRPDAHDRRPAGRQRRRRGRPHDHGDVAGPRPWHRERHHRPRSRRDRGHARQGLARRLHGRAAGAAVLRVRHDARAERHHGRRGRRPLRRRPADAAPADGRLPHEGKARPLLHASSLHDADLHGRALLVGLRALDQRARRRRDHGRLRHRNLLPRRPRQATADGRPAPQDLRGPRLRAPGLRHARPSTTSPATTRSPRGSTTSSPAASPAAAATATIAPATQRPADKWPSSSSRRSSCSKLQRTRT